VLLAVARDRRHRGPDLLCTALDLREYVIDAFQGEKARAATLVVLGLPHGHDELMRIEQLLERGVVGPAILLGHPNPKFLQTGYTAGNLDRRWHRWLGRL
jgi:hypothetical protein